MRSLSDTAKRWAFTRKNYNLHLDEEGEKIMNNSDHIKAAYYHLMRVRKDHGFRMNNQDVYAKLRDEVADIEGKESQEIQDKYEQP